MALSSADISYFVCNVGTFVQKTALFKKPFKHVFFKDST